MASNAQKIPLARSFNQIAQKQALSAIQVLGKVLPCSVVAVSGSIVTVKFEINTTFTLPPVTIPMFGPEYIRYPTQVGDKGVVLPSDVYLGGVSGLGGGTASMSLQANLSSLVFMPIANKGWSTTDDPNSVVIYGPDGVIIRTVAKDSIITVGTGTITIKAGSIVFDGPVTFNDPATGAGGVINFGSTTINAGNITSNSKNVGSTHVHSGVTAGGADTGAPI